VVAGIDGANGFTGRVSALLAEYRDKPGLHVRELALPVALDPDPVHETPLPGQLFPGHRHVVLGLAGDHAGAAARAAVEVDNHAPFVDALNYIHRSLNALIRITGSL